MRGGNWHDIDREIENDGFLGAVIFFVIIIFVVFYFLKEYVPEASRSIFSTVLSDVLKYAREQLW